MNILILSQWFDPEPNNMKALIFAKQLKERGHSVSVLTGLPNYPTGKLYTGYQRRLYQKEVMEEILVHRVYLYTSHDASALRRSLNYLSFAIFASVIGPWVIRGKIDVIYVYHPPATVVLPALVLRTIKKAGLLLDVNDLWPDTIASVGMLKSKWQLKLIDNWVNYTYKKADIINVLSPGIKNLLIKRNVDSEKITTIPVWCNESLLHCHVNHSFRKEYQLEQCFLGIYAGAMGRAQNLKTLIEAAIRLKDKIPAFRLILIGHGMCIEELKQIVREAHITNVIFISAMPPQKLTAYLNTADALFLHLKADPLFSVTIPSKAAYYLAIGKPIIAGLSGDAAAIIRASGAGIVCKPDNAKEIAEGITALYQMNTDDRAELARKGRAYYEKYLSQQAGINSFESVMKKIVLKRSKKLT